MTEPGSRRGRSGRAAVGTTVGAVALATMLLATPSGCSKDSEDTGPKEFTVFLGTYTRGWPCRAMVPMDCTSQGIYSAKFNSGTGALSTPTLAAESDNPSYLALSPNGKYLYAVNEIDDFTGMTPPRVGSVSAFAVENGSLRFLNKVSSLGGAPTHISVTRSGGTVLVANYGGGNVTAFGVEVDGKLKEGKMVQHMGMGPRPNQMTPHAHAVAEAKNGLIYVTDLGADKVFIYKLDAATSTLTANDPPSAQLAAGSGPRHLAFHPTKDIVYVNTEMGVETVVFQLNPTSGALTQLQSISATPPGTAAEMPPNTAEVQVSPDGKFVYVSVRRANQIAIYSVADDGKLTTVEFQASGGAIPRDFKLDPTGNYLLVGHQDSNDIAIHKIDKGTGKLTLIDPRTTMSKPVNFLFLP